MANTERFPKPERCATCPALKKCEQYIGIAEDRIEETLFSYQHGLPETFVDTYIKQSEEDQLLQEGVPPNRDELLALYIHGQSDWLERLESSIGATRLHMELLKLGCAGILRLRATRDAIEYTVEVCGSPQKESAGKYEDEGVRVKRRFIDE